ncbi:MAG: hypothetical protein J5725_03535 [Bacteroidales bacterium]|nr:hypothetical protein [Bacteroidales bacterium]
MMYRSMEWKKCPFCRGENLDIDSEGLFDDVKKTNGSAAICLRCRDCGAEMWVYAREVSPENNIYGVMLKRLNEKWNKRGGRKSNG